MLSGKPGSQVYRVDQQTAVEVVNSTPLQVEQSVAALTSYLYDGFGRLRVSDTQGQRVDVEFTMDLQPDIMALITAGGATIAYDSTHRIVKLSIVNATIDTKALFPQRWHNPYTPGNSQLVDNTAVLNGAGLEGTASVFLRKGGTDTVITQDNWNGTAVPDVDWSKSQIFSIDFQSLKVGWMRFNLVRNGVPVKVHTIYNDNRTQVGYWQYPNLPLNWKIYNTAAETVAEVGYFDDTNGCGFRYSTPANATAFMNAICGTVKSEGGVSLVNLPGIERAADTGVTAKSVSTTLIPLMSFRPKLLVNSVVNRGLVFPLQLLAAATGNDAIVRVYKNATLTDATFAVNPGAHVLAEVDVAATAITGGEQIGTGMLAATNQSSAITYSSPRVPLSVNYDGTSSDIITIAAVRFAAGDASVWAGAVWKDIK